MIERRHGFDIGSTVVIAALLAVLLAPVGNAEGQTEREAGRGIEQAAADTLRLSAATPLEVRVFNLPYRADLVPFTHWAVEGEVLRRGRPGASLAESIEGGGLRLRPFAAVHNLLDARYATSVSVNAFGGRYFEPAPGRTWLAGIEIEP